MNYFQAFFDPFRNPGRTESGNDFNLFYPVRNNAPLLPPGQRPSGPAAAAGLDFMEHFIKVLPFRIIPAGFNAPLEFLTGFTKGGLGDLG